MSRLLKVIAAVLVLGGAAAGAAWYFFGRSGAPSTYRTAPVRRTDIVSTISSTGTVVPEDVVDVGAQVNGQIAAFGLDKDGRTVDYRSSVDEGMLLARIDDSLYAADVKADLAQLDQAKAQVEVAQANREQARAKLDQAQRDWDRAQRLGPSMALAQADYDAARSTFEQAVASLAVTEASITQAKASVSMAEAGLLRSQRSVTYCVIKSPVSGVIIDRRVDIGQTVVASLNAPSLFLIARDLSRMQVLVQVNEADIGNVNPGQRATFTVDAWPGRNFDGEVHQVRFNATMTQNVVTYTVEIVTENADLKLLPYLTANVRFIVARHEQVLAVPSAALRWSPRQAGAPAAGSRPGGAQGQTQQPRQGRSGGDDAGSGRPGGRSRAGGAGAAVWILKDGKPQAISVKAGINDGVMTEIETSDLSEGDEVIVAEVTAASASNGAGGPSGGGASPFTPQMFRGRGR
jgi:HlyD family secretion protein